MLSANELSQIIKILKDMADSEKYAELGYVVKYLRKIYVSSGRENIASHPCFGGSYGPISSVIPSPCRNALASNSSCTPCDLMARYISPCWLRMPMVVGDRSGWPPWARVVFVDEV